MTYQPGRTGIHVCGITYERYPDGEFYSALNVNIKTLGEAKKLFRHLYLKFFDTHAVRELSVDLCLNGDIENDFAIKGSDLKALSEEIDVWRGQQKRASMVSNKRHSNKPETLRKRSMASWKE